MCHTSKLITSACLVNCQYTSSAPYKYLSRAHVLPLHTYMWHIITAPHKHKVLEQKLLCSLPVSSLQIPVQGLVVGEAVCM